MTRNKYKPIIVKQIIVKQIILKPILTDEELLKKEGDLVSEADCNRIIVVDTDAYYNDDITGEKKLLFKFRKNVIPGEICSRAYNALEYHAHNKNYNRGAAAGKLTLRKLPKYVGSIIKKDKFRVFYKTKEGETTKDNIGNTSSSNIAGYYDKPDRNAYHKRNKNTYKKTHKSTRESLQDITTDVHGIPMCRITKFTRDEPDKWNQVIPLINEVNKYYSILTPELYKNQLSRASSVPKFQIENTAYSTITVNYDWRTSIHKDKNDYDEGFGNLTVLEKSKSGHPECKGYTGGYIAFPKYGICIDMRQTDALAMDVHQYHANTEIKGEGRLSVVCYLRKNMIKCMKKQTNNI